MFGGVVEAVKRARLKAVYKQEFDEDARRRMMGEIKQLKKRLKRPLLGKDVFAAARKKQISSTHHLQRAFGSVPKAIAAANAGPK